MPKHTGLPLLPLRAMRQRRIVGGALLLFALLFVVSVPASAQQQADDDPIAVIDIDVLRNPVGVSLVPVRVSVVSLRAIEATLLIDSANQKISWELPIALPANSEVSQTILVPVSFGEINLEASLVADGETIAERRVRGFDAAASVNAVGLLGLRGTTDELQLSPSYGVASLIVLDDMSILRGLDSVVASPAGMSALTPEELDVLLGWAAGGRQLVISGDPGAIDDLLPDQWSGPDTTVFAGGGIITYIGGEWEANVPPGITVVDSANAMLGFGGGGRHKELLDDAGFRIPSFGALGLILLAYVFVVGPVAFFVMGRMNRRSIAWLVVPALALATTAGIFVAGGFLNAGRRNAHATIVEVSPVAASVTDTVLIADAGRQTMELPAGWALLSSGVSIGDNSIGAPITLRPTRTTSTLVFDIDPGSGGTAVLGGQVPGFEDSMRVVDVVAVDNVVSGTFVNDSNESLTNVLAMVGPHLAEVGTVAAGSSAAFEIDLARPIRGRLKELDAWNSGVVNFNQFGDRPARAILVPDGFEGGIEFEGDIERFEIEQGFAEPGVGAVNIGDDGSNDAVNGSSWVEWRAARIGTAIPNGMVTLVGWSRDADVSIVGGRGRTAFVTRSPVADLTNSSSPYLIRALYSDTRANVEGFGFGRGGNQKGAVTRFIRPESLDTDEVAIELLPQMTELQVLVDGDWRSLDIGQNAQNVEGSVFVPSEVWKNDVLWVREFQQDFFGDITQTTLVTADADSTAPDVLPVGERSRRNVFEPGRGFGPGFEEFEPIDAGPIEVVGNTEVVIEGELHGTYDIWSVDLVEGQTLTVTLVADFDPTLRVLNSNVEVVAENDDFDGLNSRVDFTAARDGTYTIEARPLGDPFGGYQLTVQSVTPAVADTSVAPTTTVPPTSEGV